MTESPRMPFRTIPRLARDLASLMSSAWRCPTCGGESISAKAVGAVPGAAGEAPPRGRRDARYAGRVVALRRMASSSDDCEAGHTYSLASKGIPVVLALEIEGAGPSGDSGRSAPRDRDDGGRESDVGEERIAAELLVKLGIRVSPRTVRRYMPARPPRATRGTQAWSTFVRNHARSALACDFFVVVTATFRMMCVFVVLEVGTRRIRHWNVTAHPTADWTAQQFRMIVPGDQPHRFVIHDRDTIYSAGVDRTLAAMGLIVLKTPVQVPQANAFLRKTGWHNPPRVLGLRDSDQ